MEDHELLEREKKRKKYFDFSKCVNCQESNGKKLVTTLNLPHCMNLSKLLLLLEQFVRSFWQNIGIHDLNFSQNILLKVVRHSFFKTSQDFSLLQFELLQLSSLAGLENKFEMCMFEIAGLDCNIWFHSFDLKVWIY